MAQLSFLTYLRGIYKLNLTTSSRVHNAIIQSIYDCFVMAQNDVDLARLEMCLKTASGHWLDAWGEYFSVFRKSGEEDYYYSQRIIDSVISPKCTIPAIKDNIVDYLNSTYNKDYTREDIAVKEPWKEVAKYSHKGLLSKDARFCSGDYYSHAVLDINIPEEVTDDLIDLVDSVKAAGVKVIWSILNSYDIISGFNSADDAWAAYTRWIQTQTYRHQNTGFMLSYAEAKLSGGIEGGSPHCISGGRQIWSMTTSLYQWFAKVQDKKTDESVIITKKDLIGLVDYYTIIDKKIKYNTKEKLRTSDDGTMDVDKKLSGRETQTEEIERLVYVGDEVLKSIELLDNFLTLSYEGRLSTSDGVMFNYTTSHEIFGKLMEQLEKFKQKNPDYYNAVQPPILNGERAMWLVARNENWIWNTPTMTHEDFFKLWEPYNSDEHTLESIEAFEDAYYQGYITFGDQYQPPIVVGKPFRWTPKIYKEWMFNSVVFQNFDMEQLYTRQFYSQGILENNNAKMGEIMTMEEEYSDWGYSTVGEEQPPIEVKEVQAARCTGLKATKSKINLTSSIIGKSVNLEYEVTPSNTTDLITFESSNPDVATVEDGVLTINGINSSNIIFEDNSLILQDTGEVIGEVEDGVLTLYTDDDIQADIQEDGSLVITRTTLDQCLITMYCGDYSDTVEVVVEYVETIEPAETPEKEVLTESYEPAGEQFTLYNGSFDPDSQTLYAEVELDNMTEELQNVLSVGTNISSETLGYNINLMYPKVETITAERNIIDTTDNMTLSNSTLGSADGLLSGSEYTVEQYYIKHEVDEETGEILEPVNTAKINITNKTDSKDLITELSGSLVKIAINSYGYYINGMSLKDLDSTVSVMITQVLNAIRRNQTIQVGSLIGNHRSYATYNEVSILNHIAEPSEMVELTKQE